MLIKRCHTEDDVRVYSHNLGFRVAEPYDHLNAIILKARYEMCVEMCEEIYTILRTWR